VEGSGLRGISSPTAGAGTREFGRAGSGITRFIVSGDMCGSMTYAHFEKSGSGWKVRIDDSRRDPLPSEAWLTVLQ
jgi:hypothetical protein